MNVDYSVEEPVVHGRLSLAEIEDLVVKPLDSKPNKKFYIALSISGIVNICWKIVNGI